MARIVRSHVMPDLRQSGEMVNVCRDAVRYGGPRLRNIPIMLKDVLRADAWRSFVRPWAGLATVEYGEHEFGRFVEEELGSSVEQLFALCQRDQEVLDLLDEVTQNPTGSHATGVYIIHPTGTSATATLRRLRKNHPNIHARVIAGELSPHAGAIEAGFRHRKAQIDLDPKTAARQLRKHFQGPALDALRQALA